MNVTTATCQSLLQRHIQRHRIDLILTLSTINYCKFRFVFFCSVKLFRSFARFSFVSDSIPSLTFANPPPPQKKKKKNLASDWVYLCCNSAVTRTDKLTPWAVRDSNMQR